MGRSRRNKEGDPCSVCGVSPVAPKGEFHSDGTKKFRSKCNRCHAGDKWSSNSGRRRHLQIRKELVRGVCDCCGFKAEHECQLDIDHINGNHKDNSRENLQVLCANCHRLKTFYSKDWES